MYLFINTFFWWKQHSFPSCHHHIILIAAHSFHHNPVALRNYFFDCRRCRIYAHCAKHIESQSEIKRVLILHSDQGSQYTSKDFTEYCKRMSVAQSMSKAGYPYDNAPMERYFNTLYRARYPQRMKSKGQAVYAEKECPRCGANFIPDQDGCCSYCGYRLPIDNSKWRILEQ